MPNTILPPQSAQPWELQVHEKIEMWKEAYCASIMSDSQAPNDAHDDACDLADSAVAALEARYASWAKQAAGGVP